MSVQSEPRGCVVQADRLRQLAAAILVECGMEAIDASLVADTLVQADLWGHQSHGVLRLPWYVARIRSGVVAARGRPEVISDARAAALIDGHDAMGQVVAAEAMKTAIAKAKLHGVGAVSVRNSNHFGTAMYYTRMAVAKTCIGFTSTNASPAMPPWGGRSKLVGTNPWSWAAPAGRYPPMVLDLANTAVARGKIYLARQKGEPIAAGWALDEAGEPTTDPVAALRGVTQPMANHKGYAIALMMDVVSGILSGSAFGQAVHGPAQAEKRGGVGHMMIALDIEAFIGLGEFGERMETLVDELRNAPRAPRFDEIVYPGELEARNDERQRAEGILLPAKSVGDLIQLARETGISADFLM